MFECPTHGEYTMSSKGCPQCDQDEDLDYKAARKEEEKEKLEALEREANTFMEDGKKMKAAKKPKEQSKAQTNLGHWNKKKYGKRY